MFYTNFIKKLDTCKIRAIIMLRNMGNVNY